MGNERLKCKSCLRNQKETTPTYLIKKSLLGMELNRVGGGYGTRVSPKAAGIPRNGWSRYIDRTGSWVQPLLVQLAFSHHRKYLIKRGRIYVNVNTNLKLENFSFIYGESFLIFHSLKQDFSTKIVESAAPTVSQSAF